MPNLLQCLYGQYNAGVCNWRYGAKISSTADLEAPKYIFSAPLQLTAMPFFEVYLLLSEVPENYPPLKRTSWLRARDSIDSRASHWKGVAPPRGYVGR